MQSDNNNFHPIAYFCKLKGAKSRYSATDLEAFTVSLYVHSTHMIYGRSFSIYTEHAPLTHIFKICTKSPGMSRWSMELTKYNHTIHYRQGKSNYVPDALSKSIAAVDLENIDPREFRELQRKDLQWKS